MRYFSTSRLATASLLVVALFFILSCSKGGEPAVLFTGGIQGTVSPVGAATAVTATVQGGQPVTAVPDARTGAFSFANLPAGTYQLGAVPTTGFYPPTEAAVTVQHGATAKADLQLIRDGRIRGTITWEQNGTLYSAATFHGDIKKDFFSLEGDTPFDVAGRNQGVNFVLPFAGGGNPTPFVGVGTYPIGTAQYPWAGCQFFTPNGNFDQYTTAYAGRQVGKVVVTRFDLAAGAAAGTFSFVTFLQTSTTGNATPDQTITNGHFDITF